jgi:hypothetical protein
MVFNGEPNIVRLDLAVPSRRLVEENANLEAPRPQLAQAGRDTGKRPARVQDVIHQQHVTPAHVQAQFLGEDQVRRFRAAAVT